MLLAIVNPLQEVIHCRPQNSIAIKNAIFQVLILSTFGRPPKTHMTAEFAEIAERKEQVFLLSALCVLSGEEMQI